MGKNVSLTLHDNTVLHLSLFEAQNPVGRMLHVHGINEYSGRFDSHWAFLARQGISVLTFDQRGHGLSGGPRAVFPSWKRCLEDLREVVTNQEEFLGRDYFLFCHSMGGVVGLDAVMKNVLKPKGVICSAPAFRPGSSVPGWKAAVTKLIGPFMGGLRIPSGIPGSTLSSLKEEYEKYESDPLVSHATSPKLISEIWSTGEDLLKEAPLFTLPLLMLVGDKDFLCDPMSMKAFHASAGSSDKKLKVFSEGRHELLFDVFRDETLNLMASWIKERARA